MDQSGTEPNQSLNEIFSDVSEQIFRNLAQAALNAVPKPGDPTRMPEDVVGENNLD